MDSTQHFPSIAVEESLMVIQFPRTLSHAPLPNHRSNSRPSHCEREGLAKIETPDCSNAGKDSSPPCGSVSWGSLNNDLEAAFPAAAPNIWRNHRNQACGLGPPGSGYSPNCGGNDLFLKIERIEDVVWNLSIVFYEVIP